MTGIVEIDVHGLRTEEAVRAISGRVRQAGSGRQAPGCTVCG